MSRRAPGSTQRAIPSGPFVNGDPSLPPPSTIAAQIVQNQAPEQGSSNLQNPEIFGKLLQEYLQDAVSSSAHADNEEVDLGLSAQLVTVVCRAGLDVLLEDDPFGGEVLVSQAIDSLSVVQLTVRRTPELLFYAEKLDSEAEEKPLLVWLLPKILALVGKPRLSELQDSLARLLTTFLRVLAKPTDTWRQALQLVDLYRACVTDATRALHTASAGGELKVELPSAEAISKFWSPSNHLIAIPRDCQLKITEPSHALSIALMLIDAINHLEESTHPSKGGILRTTRRNCVVWELDVVRKMWKTFIKRNEFLPSSAAADGLSRILFQMARLLNLLNSTHDTCYARAAAIYLDSHVDLLRLAPVRSDEDSILDLISKSLLDLQASPLSKQLYVDDALLPQVLRICASEAQFERILSHNVSTLFCIFLLKWNATDDLCEAAAYRITLLKADAGTPDLGDSPLAHRIQEFRASLAMESNSKQQRPSKRRKLRNSRQNQTTDGNSNRHPLFQRIEDKLLDSSAVEFDLDGIHNAIGVKFPDLGREEQQELLKDLSYASCARAGYLVDDSSRDSGTTSIVLESAACSVCDGSTSPTPKPSAILDATSSEIKATLERVTTIPEFKSNAPDRIIYCSALYRFFRHAPPEALSIKNPLGQWCLRSLRSSSRELRITAGRALTVFLDDWVRQDLRKQNRLVALDFLRQLSEKSDVATQETIILTLRRIARACGDAELNIILLILVDFLGSTNPVISGVAYTELQSLSEDLDQKPEDMFRPFWRTVAIDVVKDFISCPQKIQQLCDLIGRSVNQFLGMTLIDTIPYLIWTKNTAILNRIAERNGTSVGQLCSGSGKNLAAILSYLLLRSPSDTENNIMRLLSKAAPEFAQYDLSGWVKFQPVMVACEMLKSSADEEPAKRTSARKAIDVLAGLVEKKPGKSTPKGIKARQSFFSEYVLGIMAHFSDVIDVIRGDQLLSERRRCLRAVQELVILVEQDISVALPQVRACLQSALEVPGLQDEAFAAWSTLAMNLGVEDMENMLQHTFAVVAQTYDTLSPDSQRIAVRTIEDICKTHGDLVHFHANQLPSLASIPAMSHIENAITGLRSSLDISSSLEAFSQRCLDENAIVVVQSLRELVPFLEQHQASLHEAAIAQPPPLFITELCRAILDASTRFTDGHQDISILCAKALGVIGCLDPYRVEAAREKKDILVLDNFESFEEVVKFVVFLLETVIVKAFHSAVNARAQGFLAYAMQELLAFCNFRQVASYHPRFSQGGGESAEFRCWLGIPEHIRSTLRPFLSSHYNIQRKATGNFEKNEYPIFSPAITYSTWLRTFVLDLLHRGKGDNAKLMFSILARIIQGHDLAIPGTLLPIAILNVIIGGMESDARDIRVEFLSILEFPLEDQEPFIVNTIKQCSGDILRVLDYLRRWQQKKRQVVTDSQAAAKKTGRRVTGYEEERESAQIDSVQNLLYQIPTEVISNRAVACGAYAQALFHWEDYIRQRGENRNQPIEEHERTQIYQHLQDIYADIDEFDAVEGISNFLQVLDPEQQLLEHKKAGRWSAVQTWYEQGLDKNPTDVDLQVSLLKSLKEAGQYESLLNYADNFGRSSPATFPKILPFAAEASWVAGKWDGLERLLQADTHANDDFNVGIGKALVALRQKDADNFQATITSLRHSIATGLTNNSTASLQACHDPLLKLHVLYELESISGVEQNETVSRDGILRILDGRLELLGAFTADKQYLLNIRRAAMELSNFEFSEMDVAGIWLKLAKLSRKEKLHNIAFNAVLHAIELGEDEARIEQSRLLWEEGQVRKAIANLDGALKAQKFQLRQDRRTNDPQPINIDPRDSAHNLTAGKALLLLAKWKDKAGQTASGPMLEHFRDVTKQCARWEKSQYHLGSYYQGMLEADKTRQPEKQLDQTVDGYNTKLTIDCYLRSMLFGAKFLHQTVPKVLTLWLSMGDEVPYVGQPKPDRSRLAQRKMENFKLIQKQIGKYLPKIAPFFFYTALTQIMSRISHPNPEVFDLLQTIILRIIVSYPQQALWSLFPVLKSTDRDRQLRGKSVMNKLKSNKITDGSSDIKLMINHGVKLTDMLLHACEYSIEGRATRASLQRDLGFKHNVAAPCKLVVPVEATLTGIIPTTQDHHVLQSHKAFPASKNVTIESFEDDVLVLSSLQRPRKLTLRGSNGEKYGLLCKPKDDLRKDQRLMEFNSEIGRALKRDVESRKRRLYIHTYAVTPLNEECGAIEWVDGLKALRDIIMNLYQQKGVPISYTDIRKIYNRIQDEGQIRAWYELTNLYRPVLHEWFVESFPDPEAWFSARLRYTRSCAVTSIVGHMLGLGDRHGENVNLESGNGGVFHVDFNCLFDKGLTFERPEVVPFRLTDNMVDAFGAYHVEGPFRIAAELTLKTCRNDMPTLMTILETFLYDPTADFVSKKKRPQSTVPDTPQAVLESVKNKLNGYLKTEALPLGVEGYVDYLIGEARDPALLSQMYIGWCAYF